MGLFDFFRKGTDGGTPNRVTARLVESILLPQIEKLIKTTRYDRYKFACSDYSFGYIHGLVQTLQYLANDNDTLNLFATIEYVLLKLFGNEKKKRYREFVGFNTEANYRYTKGYDEARAYALESLRLYKFHEAKFDDLNDKYHWFNSVEKNAVDLY